MNSIVLKSEQPSSEDCSVTKEHNTSTLYEDRGKYHRIWRAWIDFRMIDVYSVVPGSKLSGDFPRVACVI